MTWKSYFASPSPFQICHFKHTRFNFLIGLNFSFRLSRGAPQQARGGEQSPAAPHPAIQPGPHNLPGPGAAVISLAKRHTQKYPRRPFSDLLFLVSRGAVAVPKGLNRRARIFEFVAVFNSQKSQTNTGLIRQPATAPASQRHPTQPSRDIPPTATTEAPTEPARPPAGGCVAGAAVSAGSPALPRLGSCRPWKAEVQYLLFTLPAPARVGKGMRSHWRNVRNGVKEKKKIEKAAQERIASKQLRAAAPLSCLLFYLNTPSFSRKKTSVILLGALLG